MSITRSGPALIALTLPLLLTGCGSNGDAQVRLLNASAGYAALDVDFDKSGSSTNSAQISDVASGSISGYTAVSPDTYTVYFTSHGVAQANALSSTSESFSNSEHRTYVAYGDSGSFGELEIDEDQGSPGNGQANVEVLDADPDAGSLDVYLTSAGLPLNDASPNFTAVKGGSSTGFTVITDGTYELRITGTGKKSDLRFDVPGITLSNQETVSLIITESPGGYLVSVIALPQRGSLTTYTNPDARVRGVIGLSSGTSITASVGGTALVSAAPATAVGTYELVPAGSQSVALTVDGTSVSQPGTTLVAGQDYTFLVYGSASSPKAAWLEDENIPPLSGYSSVRLVNADSASGDPMSLSIDFMPVASDIPLGGDVPSGSPSGTSAYDTQVTATTTATVTVTDYANSQTLFTQTAATLGSQDVYTMFMFGSAAVLTQDR